MPSAAIIREASSCPPAVNGNKQCPQSDIERRERGTYSPKWGVSIREPWRRGGGKSQRGHQRHQENKALYTNWAKLILAHRDWSSEHRAYTGLHQILCVYIIASSLAVFMGLLSVAKSVCFWFSCLLLDFSSCCWFSLSNFDVMLFVLSCILFCCCLLEACSFLRRDRKGMDPDGRELGRNKEE